MPRIIDLVAHLLPEIDQPEIESGGCEDHADRREAPDTPPESQQQVHVLHSPPLEHPQRADQVAAHCGQRCCNLDEVQRRQWPGAHRQDRASDEHSEQYRQLAELIDLVVESRRGAKGLWVGAGELEEHFRDHHAQPHAEHDQMGDVKRFHWPICQPIVQLAAQLPGMEL